MIHLMIIDTVHGAIPLCGRAMWDGLTSQPDRNECWECASIKGTAHISHPHLTEEAQ
jgi:hypothetical protein